MEKKTCHISGASFVVTDQDQEFYKKFDVPIPDLCPEERRRLRYLFRNERHLYHRACDLTQQPTLSIYHPSIPLKVYASSAWWSDKWDPRTYGRDFDFKRPFFEQYKELAQEVPRLAIQNIKSENCEYTNYSAENKNCYMVTGTLASEDCYYSYRIFYSKDIVDCYDMFKCELCYESIQCKKAYNCRHCKNIESSSNLTLCTSCIGCNNCFGCVNLRNKSFHIFNTPYSEEEYYKKVNELLQNFEAAKQQFEAFRLQQPHRATYVKNCENSRGDQLINCKNCNESYILKDSEDCAYVCFGSHNKDCIDANHTDNSELQYNSSNIEKNYAVIAGNLAWYIKNAAYVTLCFNSHHLFGCIGMKKNEYCILNKQYTKEEYDQLVPKIIHHMKKTGEWGNYFPAAHSPFAYNESTAQDHFPLTKEEALARGYTWRDHEQKTAKHGTDIKICAETQKPFKLIPQEIQFYKKMNLPHPTVCPEKRLLKRQMQVNSHKLWQRHDARTHEKIWTSYHPNQKEIVYSEDNFIAATT